MELRHWQENDYNLIKCFRRLSHSQQNDTTHFVSFLCLRHSRHIDHICVDGMKMALPRFTGLPRERVRLMGGREREGERKEGVFKELHSHMNMASWNLDNTRLTMASYRL